jgi:hypothetical protein
LSELVRDDCTLPTAQRPLRVEEFDALFTAAQDAQRLSDRHLRVTVAGGSGVEASVRDLPPARPSAAHSSPSP